MAGIKQSEANATLDARLTGTLQLRLFTAAPTATTNGTEASGGGYTPQSITLAAATGATKTQSADVAFAAATADIAAGATQIVAWAITDGSGNQKYFKVLAAPFNWLTGDPVKFLVATNPVVVSLT